MRGRRAGGDGDLRTMDELLSPATNSDQPNFVSDCDGKLIEDAHISGRPSHQPGGGDGSWLRYRLLISTSSMYGTEYPAVLKTQAPVVINIPGIQQCGYHIPGTNTPTEIVYTLSLKSLSTDGITGKQCGSVRYI